MKPAAVGGQGDGFASLSNLTSMLVPINPSINTSGTVSGLAGSRFPAWEWPDSATAQANLMLDEDEAANRGWSTFNIDLLHANPNAGTGNVVLTITTSVRTSSQDLTAGDNVLTNGVAVPAGATNILTTYRVASGLAIVPGGIRHLRISRAGADVNDTLVGVWRAIAYRFTKAS